MTNIDDQTMTIVYGMGDIVRSVTRFDGSTVTNGYDHAGRGTSTVFTQGQDQRTVTMAYTANSLIESIADGAVTLNYGYDGLNRLTEASTTINNRESKIENAYDPVGNVTGSTVEIGEGQGMITINRAYAHDVANRLTGLTAESGTFAFNYRADNGLVETVASVDSGIGVTYDFDIMDRPEEIAWRDDQQGLIRSFAMTYAQDENENDLGTDMIEKIAHEDDTYRVYGYDSIDRLTHELHYDETATLIHDAEYTYDLAGNRTQTVINRP